MTFDDWFNTKHPEGSIKPEVMRQAFREVALDAWQAALGGVKPFEFTNLSTWSEKDKGLLVELMNDQGMSMAAVIRQAVRLYQYRHAMSKEGFPEIQFVSLDGRIFTKMSKLPPDFEG